MATSNFSFRGTATCRLRMLIQAGLIILISCFKREGGRESSVAMSTYCSCRGPGSTSQRPQDRLQLSNCVSLQSEVMLPELLWGNVDKECKCLRQQDLRLATVNHSIHYINIPFIRTLQKYITKYSWHRPGSQKPGSLFAS